MNKTNTVKILAMAFYGNRTGTSIDVEDVDRFILGYLDSTIAITEPIDRTMIRVPDTEELVIIYNKYQEEVKIEQNKKWLQEDDYVAKPLAFIPEKGVEIYSRCIVCRQDSMTGELKNFEAEDYAKVSKYLAR